MLWLRAAPFPRLTVTLGGSPPEFPGLEAEQLSLAGGQFLLVGDLLFDRLHLGGLFLEGTQAKFRRYVGAYGEDDGRYRGYPRRDIQ